VLIEMPTVTGIGHVGLHTSNLAEMRDFYTDVLGLHVTDDDADHGIVFLSADPRVEHHHLVLARVPDGEQLRPVLQQVSFRCSTLDDVIGYFQRFVTTGTEIQYAVTHGNAIGVYFFDPDGNRCEVYWPTGLEARQAFRVSVDLTKPSDELLADVSRLVHQHGKSGFVESAPPTRRSQLDGSPTP
jgi:catechol-2,3-dioxygenase